MSSLCLEDKNQQFHPQVTLHIQCVSDREGLGSGPVNARDSTHGNKNSSYGKVDASSLIHSCDTYLMRPGLEMLSDIFERLIFKPNP